MEIFKTPMPVDWQNQRVLTTAQLAKYYECTVKQIQQNFNNNQDRFVAGKHYFKLEGELLKQFKTDYFDKIDSVNSDYFDEIELVGRRAPHLYFWTARGCARHAKMLSTDKAWEVYEKLEDNYFNRIVETAPVPTKTARRPLSPTACVYVLLLSNGTVKIGHTSNLRERVAKIKNCTGLKVDRLYFTLTISRDIARLIEWACQENFSSRKVGSEIFNADFNESCEVVNSFVKVVLDRNNELLKVADRMESSPERQAILITAANTFVGRILP